MGVTTLMKPSPRHSLQAFVLYLARLLVTEGAGEGGEDSNGGEVMNLTPNGPTSICMGSPLITATSPTPPTTMAITARGHPILPDDPLISSLTKNSEVQLIFGEKFSAYHSKSGE